MSRGSSPTSSGANSSLIIAVSPWFAAMLPTCALASPQPVMPHWVSTRAKVASNEVGRPKSLVCCLSGAIGMCTQYAWTEWIFISASPLADRPSSAAAGCRFQVLYRYGNIRLIGERFWAGRMALEEYRRKRDFRKTPEPAGRGAPHRKTGEGLSFVIQKHAARRLHYDFRLELDGVLKSWAVPRGPSLDPGEKRLAVHVEDHPLDYGEFEGVIPEGEYGGGTVLLWDRGIWTPADPDPEAAYRKGSLKFALDGEKLRGKWALVRMGGKAAGGRRENWLLVKERDEAALPHSGDAVVADNPLSVATGRSLDAIASDRDWVWHSKQDQNDGAPVKTAPLERLHGARKGPMAKNPKPQLATVTDKAPEGDDWLHEIKYDGYRLLARIEGGKARLITRGGLDWTAKFPELARQLGELPIGAALIDGELVRLQPDGTTSFAALQDAISGDRTQTLTFFAFDLL